MIAALIPDSCLVEVAVLSNLAQVFGLLDSVQKMLEMRKQQTDPSQEQILSTLTSEYTPKPSSTSGAFRLVSLNMSTHCSLVCCPVPG